jgi:hypothetical protein
MGHSVTLPSDIYKVISEEAKHEYRTIPMQIAYWAKLAKAATIAKANNMYIDDTLEIMEASESKDGIVIEDIDAYFKTGGEKGHRPLGKGE